MGDLGDVGLVRKKKSVLHSQVLAINEKFHPQQSALAEAAAAKPQHEEAKEAKAQEAAAALVPEREAKQVVSKSAPAAPAHAPVVAATPHHPELAFGDSTFVPASRAPTDREGSVRGGTKPDFAPPLGDLGEVGLKVHPAAAPHAQTLVQKHTPPAAPAEHAAAHAAPTDIDVRPEGHESKAVPEDPAVSAPTTRAVASGASSAAPKLSADASRASLDGYFAQQLRATGATTASAPAAAPAEVHLSAEKARAGLESFYAAKEARDSLKPAAAPAAAAADARESSKEARARLAAFFARKQQQLHEAAAAASAPERKGAAGDQGMLKYFAGLKAEDSKDHATASAAAVSQAAAAHSSMAAYFSALQAHDANEAKPAAKAATPAGQAAEPAVPSEKKAVLQSLAGGFQPQRIFGEDAGNKHGFHPRAAIRSGAVKAALRQANVIAKKDLDDCGFTLC